MGSERKRPAGIENIADRVIETDVLVVGCGVGGAFASIKAAKAGARVVTWEKAYAERSGGAGSDLIMWYGLPVPPEKEEEEKPKETVAAAAPVLRGKLDGLADKNFAVIIARDSWDRIHDLESWGINMRWDDGEYYIHKSAFTGLPTGLRINPTGMKKKLTEQVIKSGVELLNRTMAVDLLTQDGAVVGATGFNVRTGQFIVCKAKAVILATSSSYRQQHQYQGPALGMYKMIYEIPDTGDGMAMAFRAGTELVNMELPARDRALMYEYDKFIGKIGATNELRVPLVNAKGEKIGETSLRHPEQLTEQEKGTLPVYIDGRGLSEEHFQWIERVRAQEYPIAVRLTKIRGLDWRTDKFELTDYFPYGTSPLSGILVDTDTKTSVRGLFACAGNAGGGAFAVAMASAAIFGAIAGKNAAKHATEVEKVRMDESQVERHKESVFAPIKRRDGVPPLELELKLRDIMCRYCGLFRNEGKLDQGLWRLNSVRDKFFPEMIAKTSHELMRCQEVRKLYLIGEAILVSSRERKESGPGFYRKDYPEEVDALFETAIVLRLKDGEIKISRRKMPELRNESKK